MNGCLNVTESADATVLATFHEGKTSINQSQGTGFVGALTQVREPNNISLVQLPSSKIGKHKSSTWSVGILTRVRVTLNISLVQLLWVIREKHKHTSNTGYEGTLAQVKRCQQNTSSSLRFGIITHPLNHVLTGDGLQLHPSPTTARTLSLIVHHNPPHSTAFSQVTGDNTPHSIITGGSDWVIGDEYHEGPAVAISLTGGAPSQRVVVSQTKVSKWVVCVCFCVLSHWVHAAVGEVAICPHSNVRPVGPSV
jgi:hypothetical protein